MTRNTPTPIRHSQGVDHTAHAHPPRRPSVDHSAHAHPYRRTSSPEAINSVASRPSQDLPAYRPYERIEHACYNPNESTHSQDDCLHDVSGNPPSPTSIYHPPTVDDEVSDDGSNEGFATPPISLQYDSDGDSFMSTEEIDDAEESLPDADAEDWDSTTLIDIMVEEPDTDIILPPASMQRISIIPPPVSYDTDTDTDMATTTSESAWPSPPYPCTSWLLPQQAEPRSLSEHPWLSSHDILLCPFGLVPNLAGRPIDDVAMSMEDLSFDDSREMVRRVRHPWNIQ